MKILVIPDIHLKPWIFDKASNYLENGIAEGVVCLMDIADDWDQMFNIDLYTKTYDTAIKFAKKFPNTLWCYGNHDISYIAKKLESGYSPYAENTVYNKIHMLKESLNNEDKLKYIHKIDNIIFCHGGLSSDFVKNNVDDKIYDDVDLTIEFINNMSFDTIWTPTSPIWFRPQYSNIKMYKEGKFFHVVGHTPIEKPYEKNHVLSCDSFSTYRNGKNIGNSKFVVIDTKTCEWFTI